MMKVNTIVFFKYHILVGNIGFWEYFLLFLLQYLPFLHIQYNTVEFLNFQRVRTNKIIEFKL
jgi:hypothetical protein